MALTTVRAKSVDMRSTAARSWPRNTSAPPAMLVALASSYSSEKFSAGFSHSFFFCSHVLERHADDHGEAVASRELRVGEGDRHRRDAGDRAADDAVRAGFGGHGRVLAAALELDAHLVGEDLLHRLVRRGVAERRDCR